VSYAWNFGDGATGSGALASHVYTTPGPIRTEQ
jgi:PKD repeat protein